jgi:hypothetical protein
MTTAVAQERAGAAPKRGLAERRHPPAATHSATRPVASEVAPGSEPSTLEDALLGAWEDLDSRGRAECLVCGGSLEVPEAGSPTAAGVVGGECSACGATLG